jgi:hypothetical protein
MGGCTNSLANRGSYMVLVGSIGDDFLGRDKNTRSHKYVSSHKHIKSRWNEDLRK